MNATPVSLPPQTTLPAPGTTILPSSITSSLASHSLPSQSSHSRSSSLSHSAFAPPPIQNNNATTRILLLSDFDEELKTRDIAALFEEWEEQNGGFKIKWCDDKSCWVVFNDPGTAKRAYLTLLSSPPPALQPSDSHKPSLKPYTGPETTSILSAVAARPRSRSNAGGHSRKGSLMGSGGGSVLAGSIMGGVGNSMNGGGHARSPSFGRDRQARGGSFGQKQMREMMEHGAGAQEGSALDTSSRNSPPPVPKVPEHLAQSANRGSSPVQERRAGPSELEENRERVRSPSATGGHRRSESRSGSDQVASAIEGLTIAE